jgi:hypothetical protein
MTDMRPEERLEYIRQIIRNPVLAEAFIKAEQLCIAKWRNAATVAEREEQFFLLNAVNVVVQEIQSLRNELERAQHEVGRK